MAITDSELNVIWKTAVFNRLEQLLELFPHHVKEWFRQNKEKLRDKEIN